MKLVSWSFLYFFCLLAAYFILRPIRDEMGIANGAANMQWLFTGTFVAMIVLVPLFGFISSKLKTSALLNYSYIFFISNILTFYILFNNQLFSKAIPAAFFIWLSVFNLFAVSIFWSFMVDIFSIEQSKRLFGIISLGGSLGALTGPYLVQIFIKDGDITILFLLATTLIFCTIISLNRIVKIGANKNNIIKFSDKELIQPNIKAKDLFDGVRLVIRSKYLLSIVGFMILYSSISTFLYFEQAHIVEQALNSSKERLIYFSKIDLWINTITIFGQVFLTARLIIKLGLVIILSTIPLLVGFGFLILSSNTSLVVIGLLLIIHRAANYVLLRPAREILYTSRTKKEKYKAKNVIDTLIYRGGDSLSGWLFSGLLSFGLSLSLMALVAVPMACIWAIFGYTLGLKHRKQVPQLMANINKINLK